MMHPATLSGRAQYAQRKWLSEAPNGCTKEVLGFRRFSVRGLDKARVTNPGNGQGKGMADG